MSAAYDSALKLSFDVRGGLFMRQLHHWAALLFVAVDRRPPAAHLLHRRVPPAARDQLAASASVMLVLALLMGVTGYSLPDDLLSGTGLRIISAILLSIPVIGTWAHFAVFNGDYVGEQIIGRFYIVHVLLIPAILLALIALHLLILVKQKHTQFPGAGPHRAQRRRQPALPDVRRQGDRPGLRGVRRLRRCSAAWCRSTRSGCGARTTRRRCPRPRSPTGTSGSSTGRRVCSRPWDINLPGSYTIPALFWPTVVIAGAMFTLAGALPDHRAQAHRRHRRRTTCCSVRATSRCAPRSAPWRLTFYVCAVDVRRQRRHRRQVRHQPERDDVGRPDRR